MLKKFSLIALLFIVFLCITTFSFAADDVKNTLNSGVNTVVDGVNNLGSDVRNGVGTVENGVENVFKDDGSSLGNIGNNDNSTNYNATRVDTTTAGISNMATDNLWIWVVVAIAAIVIIGLVWYYASQDNAINNRH